MVEIARRSPVAFNAKPVESESRDNWTVVLAYSDEGGGPYLTDLSHKTRWDVQSGRIDDITPAGVTIPAAPGRCEHKGGVLINRMNRIQAAVWHLQGPVPDMPPERAYTDVTDSTVFLALHGGRVFSIAEKLSALDFKDPRKKRRPFLLQGPFSHVPCQLVAFDDGLLLTCSRGYGRDMVHAIMEAGAEFGLRPAGENRFAEWMAAV